MISLLIFLFVLGTLIIVHEFGHFIMAKRIGVRVDKFSLGFGPQLLKKKKDNTEYSISAILLGGYVKLAGDNLEEYKGGPDEYFSKPPGKRFWIIFCGPLLNYLLGFLVFWLVFFAGYPTLTTRVGGLIDGLGAKQAGIQVGDKITAVDGEKVKYWEDLQDIIRAEKTATKVIVSVLRDNKEQKIEVSIGVKQLSDQLGEARNVRLLGITPYYEDIVKVRHGLAESFILAIKKTWELTAMTCKGLWRMVTGKLLIRETITGPLGILYIASKAAKVGIIALLHLMAVLSISLGIFNLLPLPVLDGGHIVLLGIEKIRGRTLSLKAEQIITQVGTTIIVSLAIFVTYNDILRLFGDKLSKFFISR
jgi:regulator of sigma E protease